MIKEKLYSLVPTEVVKEEEVNEKIEAQKELVETGKKFVSQLSINRYMYTKLADFNFSQRLNFFSELMDADFHIYENGLYFSSIDAETLAAILEEKYSLEDMYELDNFYIESLLNGKDIAKDSVDVYGDQMSLQDVFQQLVFSSGGMPMGDTPNLMMMLVVKKALLGSALAEQNIETLTSGKREIYDISSLF